ncbi:MAG: CRISPR-associated endonuclease Cas3'', partial [Syntrophomonadaceae bacterium]|nr:CRISPR-associated endonuclease Cas3'' [Syntrophomonadaceae bacterium]
MNSGNIFSNRDKELPDHLISTTAIADVIAKGCGVELSEKDRLAILLHDIAKAHPRFQKRLLQNKGRFGHSEPSSALVFGLTRDMICAEAIRRHHSRLQNIDEVKKFWGNEWDYKTEKAGGLNSVIAGLQWWQGAEEIAEKCRLEVSSWLDLLPDQDEWEDILFDLDDYGCDQNEGVVNDWLRLRMLYSILVAADRYEAAVSKKTINYSPLISDPAKIDDYLSGTEPSDISAWRNEIRLEVVQNAERFIQKPGVFTLTLPTGAGKTLIGMEIAMQVARRFQYSTLIYVLPFVSLVEQNADVAAKLFDVVQEDHYLSYPESDSEEATPEERFVAFFRYWQEPVIVTTLAKLWNVLYSPRANDTMSFHRLSNSVVILDEPQVVRTSCWEGFGKTLQLLVDKLGTTFILMTATQPEIARGTELAPESVKFPLVRHELHWISGQGKRMSIAEAADFLIRQGVLEKSSLLVLNTRESALRMYGEMKKRG